LPRRCRLGPNLAKLSNFDLDLDLHLDVDFDVDFSWDSPMLGAAFKIPVQVQDWVQVHVQVRI
jgi:hypothetical protein